MLEALRIDPEVEVARIVDFITHQFHDAGYSRAVVGVSGGVDSALVAALCARALGAENVYGLLLPYATSNPASTAHGRLVCEELGLPHELFDITPAADALIARDPEMASVRKGNIMSRCRMVVLYDQSAAWNGLVMGTGNRTESLLGYFTLYGDSACALRPIGHLYKCQVRTLARHLGLPEAVVGKAPSADLWAGQTDEGDLGFTYDDADQILYLLTEEGLDDEHAAQQGFDVALVRAVRRRMERYAFKLRQPAGLATVAEARRNA